jgi:hypothetical protein
LKIKKYLLSTASAINGLENDIKELDFSTKKSPQAALSGDHKICGNFVILKISGSVSPNLESLNKLKQVCTHAASRSSS